MQVHFLHAEKYAGGLPAIFALSRTITFETSVVAEFDRHYDPPLFPSKLILGYEGMPTIRNAARRSFTIYADIVVILTSPSDGRTGKACKIARYLSAWRHGPKACLLVALKVENRPMLDGITVLCDPSPESLIAAIIGSDSRS
ncbi:hypothetical protein HQ524_04020 [Candidatus Uhrbacteria bacterium]|nr:hypothetical protein [Candidatus Uhrbacteria bacterium]